jgi:hypothetical protein
MCLIPCTSLLPKHQWRFESIITIGDAKSVRLLFGSVRAARIAGDGVMKRIVGRPLLPLLS